jgi:hypothetical protein
MVTVPWETAVYYAGGRSTGFNPANSLITTDMIEKITFPDLPATPEVEKLAVTLSRARAQLGCALVGDDSDVAMFVGGWFYDQTLKQFNASDAVDMILTRSQTMKSSQLSFKTISPTIAGVSTLVLVTGGGSMTGAPFFGNAVDGYDYASYHSLGVDRYDFVTDQWQFVPNVLTRLLYNANGAVPTRIAASFASRFIAVVAGQSLFKHDGSVDPNQINATSHRRPMYVVVVVVVVVCVLLHFLSIYFWLAMFMIRKQIHGIQIYFNIMQALAFSVFFIVLYVIVIVEQTNKYFQLLERNQVWSLLAAPALLHR